MVIESQGFSGRSCRIIGVLQNWGRLWGRAGARRQKTLIAVFLIRVTREGISLQPLQLEWHDSE